jgi:hypothetical protein
VVSNWFYRAAAELSDIEVANRLGTFSGLDNDLDIGANVYFNPKTKLFLF